MILVKKIPLLLLLLFASHCLAQSDVTEVKVDPMPYDITPYLGKTETKSIKQCICISDYDIRRAKLKDTIFARYYDTVGNKTIDKVYLYGKKTLESTFEYFPKKKLKISYSKSFTNKSIDIIKTYYTASGKILSFESADVIRGDTVDRGGARFFYDKYDQLIKSQNFFNKNPYMAVTYQYNGKNMVMKETKSLNNPNFSRVVYRYDANDVPIEKITYGIRPANTDSLPPTFYEYAGKKLISEKYPDSSNPKKYTTVNYSYNNDGKIDSILFKEDTLYKQTTYVYNDKYIVKIATKSNAQNMFYYGYTGSSAGSLTTLPVRTEINYFYDAKGYLIKSQETLNGILQSTKIYNIEYY